MARIVIRTAVADDLQALRLVFRRSSWSNEGDRRLLTEHPEFLELSDAAVLEGRTRLASVDGEIVGFASLIGEGEALELDELFVDPDRTRGGIGRALIEDAAACARAAGATRIEVDGNEHALDFYASVGFATLGPVQLEHGTAVRMSREVS